MTSTVAADLPGEDREVPLWRLHVLRATYAIFVLPALVMIPFGTGPLPKLIFHAPTDRGMISAMLAGLFVMTVIGLRYPLKMLPIFLFEFSWKAIWLLFYGLPQWLAGVRTAQFNLDIGEGT